tara:strand:- start:28 stop:489 length:462 start_codon:yes stop_codon:yes gene_type:complete
VTEVRFYHLTNSSIEDVLPSMLERAVSRDKKRVMVLAGSVERVEYLSNYLWIYSDKGFLPHGSKEDGRPEMQPIWITDSGENINEANLLFLVDGGFIDSVKDFDLVCNIFDSRDSNALSLARKYWDHYQKHQHELTYWQQTIDGKWQKESNFL